MKKILLFLMVAVMVISIFTACSNGGDKANLTDNSENTTEANQKTETITISSRNAQEPLKIVYEKEILSLGDVFSSEANFIVSDAINEKNEKSEIWTKNAGLSFSVSFISDITALEDYNASMGDASVVIKLTEPQKIILGDGIMVYCYDELWYDEFKTRYYLYEKDGDLIKFTLKEQISDEQIKFIFSILEFK